MMKCGSGTEKIIKDMLKYFRCTGRGIKGKKSKRVIFWSGYWKSEKCKWYGFTSGVSKISGYYSDQ